MLCVGSPDPVDIKDMNNERNPARILSIYVINRIQKTNLSKSHNPSALPAAWFQLEPDLAFEKEVIEKETYRRDHHEKTHEMNRDHHSEASTDEHESMHVATPLDREKWFNSSNREKLLKIRRWRIALTDQLR